MFVLKIINHFYPILKQPNLSNYGTSSLICVKNPTDRIKFWSFVRRELISFKGVEYYHKLTWFMYHTNVLGDHCCRKWVYWILWLQYLAFIRILFLYFYPLSHLQRIEWADAAYIYFDDNLMNLLYSAFIMCVFIEKNVYFNSDRRLFAILNGIINHPSICPELTYNPFDDDKWLFTLRQLMIVLLNSLQIIVNSMIAINIFYLHWTTYTIIQKDWPKSSLLFEFEFQNLTNFIITTIIIYCQWLFRIFIKIIWFELNTFIFMVDIMLKSRTLITGATYILAYTILFYVELKQIAQILYHNHYDQQLQSSMNNITIRINRFMYKHNRLFERIMMVDRVMSKTFFWFMMASLPINIYLSAWILAHFKNIMINFRPLLMHYIVAILIVFGTLLGVFFVHYILVLYPTAIHSKSGIKHLLHLEACRLQQQRPLNNNHSQFKKRIMNCRILILRTHLKQVNYIAKFHVKNRYGFTYCNTGLITLNSFFRSLMIYLKVLLLVYKLHSI
ncbi:hypothetical protein DERF_005629 [Dermatophagoides farinae]|uniref:Uncharacterized protein n=1 Tax=Dermatophagoides farinae TaxID=6954 RepID=A0A922L6S8_DERFA|nr:uncharacterized protein LOC124500559 [Dermatophagoides farinae]KAH7639374.1 hypothetical protein HUG17_3407 [Dermatophagoides farinae]KAH9522024.1 hypothetical protein DERF_005629 [Dermatophagoides farinae]